MGAVYRLTLGTDVHKRLDPRVDPVGVGDGPHVPRVECTGTPIIGQRISEYGQNSLHDGGTAAAAE